MSPIYISQSKSSGIHCAPFLVYPYQMLASFHCNNDPHITGPSCSTPRSASVLASAGFAAASSVTSVSIRSVKFADYSTGGVKDVTAAYLANKCTSTAYSTLSAYQQSNSGCRFSSQSLPFSAEGAIAVCQGFVASVAYTITHSTSSYGTIDTVTAALTVSDVPVFPRPALVTGTAAITPDLPVTSVSQSFSVTFTSADNSQASNVNGNVVRRFVNVYCIALFRLLICPFSPFPCPSPPPFLPFPFSTPFLPSPFPFSISPLRDSISLAAIFQTPIRQSRLSARPARSLWTANSDIPFDSERVCRYACI